MGGYLPILVTPNMEMTGALRHAASTHPLRSLHLLVKPDLQYDAGMRASQASRKECTFSLVKIIHAF